MHEKKIGISWKTDIYKFTIMTCLKLREKWSIEHCSETMNEVYASTIKKP